MLTARYMGNREIGIHETEPEPPRPGQVQIDVAYAGICGSDLHVLHGDMDDRISLPAIIGHEMSGLSPQLAMG